MEPLIPYQPLEGRQIGGLAGVSGGGKDSVIRLLKEWTGCAIVLSTTDRSATRPGEEEGLTYHYASQEQFESYVQENAFYLHPVGEYGNRYGYLLRHVEAALESGRPVLFQGIPSFLNELTRYNPQAHSAFLRAPSREEQRRRLSDRGGETPESIEKRLDSACREQEQALFWGVPVVTNRDLVQTARLVQRMLDFPNC